MHITDIHFLFPLVIWIGLPVSLICIWLFIYAEKRDTPQINTPWDIQQVFWIGRLVWYGRILLLFLICSLFVLLLAHPYKIGQDIEIQKDGIDIVLVMDISESMNFPDFEPSRMEVAKSTLRDFVADVSSDRLGLIVFAGKPISSQLLTFDYAIIDETLAGLSPKLINQNIRGLSGTNIGDALLLAPSLFDTPEREKVIILVTDGDANSGADPTLVAQVLKQKGISVYTIWIWKQSSSEILINNGFFQQKQTVPPLDSTTLQNIADTTGWVFFRADDGDTLQAIFDKLKELQTTEITSRVEHYQTDYYSPFIYTLLILLILLTLTELIYPKCK